VGGTRVEQNDRGLIADRKQAGQDRRTFGEVGERSEVDTALLHLYHPPLVLIPLLLCPIAEAGEVLCATTDEALVAVARSG